MGDEQWNLFLLGEPFLELELSGINLPEAGGGAAEAPSPFWECGGDLPMSAPPLS